MGNLRYDILLFNNSKILGREDFYFCRGFIFFFVSSLPFLVNIAFLALFMNSP